MNKFFAFIVFTFLLIGCKKSSLNIINSNAPTSYSLTTENGIKSFALGIINKQFGNVENIGKVNLFVVALTQHSLMGDELFSPYGNFGFRWANQVYSIQPPVSTAPVINPFGISQLTSLQGFNNREAGQQNVFLYEWNFAYNYITQSNQLLAAINNPALTLQGSLSEINTKKAVLKAWAYWWKGFAYSRIGSIYLAGLKVDEAGSTTNDYVSHDKIILEANTNFDLAISSLDGISADEMYIQTFKSITPSYNLPENVIEPNMWIHIINTLKARNLLVNKKFSEMNASDWNNILSYTENGVSANDHVFMQGMTVDGTNDASGGYFHPFVLNGTMQEFTFVSERLMQEFHENDRRLQNNFTMNGVYPPNIRGRGLQFGTRWTIKNIEDGGSFATNNNQGAVAISSTYEENELMKAEALINLGSIEEGLLIIDHMRNYQQADIPSISNTGLDVSQANEELRRERRVALFMRGTAFYDARRWGLTADVSLGGGRYDGMVYLPVSYLEAGSTLPQVRPCIINYKYVDYFDVPAGEFQLNQPSLISSPIKN
jgi:hypothetical protein